MAEAEGVIIESKIYGYIRVSSKDQNEDRQLIALHGRGVKDDYIYIAYNRNMLQPDTS